VAKGRLGGESTAQARGRRAGGGRTRTHTEATARESGYGSSRGESSEGRLQWTRAARNKAAKRRGATEAGVFREGHVRSVNAAGSVERGKNPEDGTGEGLATLAHHHGGSAAGAAKRGTRRSCVQGSRKPTRGGSRANPTLAPAPADTAEREARAVTTRQGL